MTLDTGGIQRDGQFDGTHVVTTNTRLSAPGVASTYKSLWRVERAFRTENSVLEMRPLYHHTDRNSSGRLVACFLALRLDVDLQRRLDEKGLDVSWPDLMRALDGVQAVLVDLDGQPLPPAHRSRGPCHRRLRGRRGPPAQYRHAARSGPTPPPPESEIRAAV